MWKLKSVFLVFLVIFSSVITMPTKVNNLDNLKTLQNMFLKDNSISGNDGNSNQTSRTILRKGATMGMLLGAVQAEERMEKKLLNNCEELFKNLKNLENHEIIEKVEEIEHQMQRDRRAMQILTNAICLAMNGKSINEYRGVLRNIAAEDAKSKLENGKLKSQKASKKEAQMRVDKLKLDLNDHLKQIRTNMSTTAKEALKYLKTPRESPVATTTETVTTTTTSNSLVETSKVTLSNDEMNQLEKIMQSQVFQDMLNMKFDRKGKQEMQIVQLPLMSHNQPIQQKYPPIQYSNNYQMNPNFFPNGGFSQQNFAYIPNPYTQQNFPMNHVELFNPQTLKQSEKLQLEFETLNSNQLPEKPSIQGNSKKNENQVQVDVEVGSGSDNENDDQSEKDEEFNEEENSNQPGGLVGLIASLSGGEEGSDVGALIGAVSGLVTNLFGPDGLDIPSLLSTGTSLIAGLLGGDQNFGTVLGGYVGTTIEGLSGGGADNNGAFFGNLLGTILAQLSSDPEDDENPPKPKLFLDSFFQSFVNSKYNQVAEDEDPDGSRKSDKNSGSAGFFGFISNIVSSLVGGVTSLILNVVLESSGGSSQGSADLSAGSSGASTSASGGSSSGSSEET